MAHVVVLAKSLDFKIAKQNGHQVGITGSFADAVNGGIDVTILTAVNCTFLPPAIEFATAIPNHRGNEAQIGIQTFSARVLLFHKS